MARYLTAALVTVVALAAGRVSAHAQTVEVIPAVGYRFGGSFFEVVTGQEVDLDGASTLGVAINLPFQYDLQIEGFFTHQEGRVIVPVASGPPVLFPITVDHWMAGGLREMKQGRMRPFLTGLLGLTRYGIPGDNEVRFTVSAGTGVKLLPTRNLGVRLDGRVFATFADIEGRAIACTPGICLFALDATVLWQAEFTAGVVVAF